MTAFDSNDYDQQPEDETPPSDLMQSILSHPDLQQYMSPEQQQQMTHQPEQPNPVPDIVDKARQAIAFDPLAPAPPLWQARTLSDLLNHPAAQVGLLLGGTGKARDASGIVKAAVERRTGRDMLSSRLQDLKLLNQESVARATGTPEQGYGVTPQRGNWVTLPDGTKQQLIGTPSVPVKPRSDIVMKGPKPSVPLPMPEEPLDPKDIAEFMKIFGHR